MAGRNDGTDREKLSKRRPEGLALSEYLDDAGVNSSSTAVGEPGQDAPPPPSVGRRVLRTVETVIANPTLVIATVAAIPLLLLAWGLARPGKKPPEETK